MRLAADLAEEKERLALVNKQLAPKAAVCDAIVKNDMHRTASEVGKALGMSAIKLNRKLEAVGVMIFVVVVVYLVNGLLIKDTAR